MSIKLSNGGAYLVNGTTLVYDGPDAEAKVKASGGKGSSEEARKSTIAHAILRSHNTSDDMDKLKIKFPSFVFSVRSSWGRFSRTNR